MQLNCQELELQSPIEYFYAIQGAPNRATKPNQLHYRKIFIQSASQGSKCLKKGAKLLYLEEVLCNQ